MFCEQCGSELKDNYKFCEQCGHPASGLVNNVNSQPSVPVQPGYYENQSQVIVKEQKKGFNFFVGIAIVIFVVLFICIGISLVKRDQKKQSTIGSLQADESVENEIGAQENHENGIRPENEDSVINEKVDLGAYSQCIGYWAKNNVDTLSAETFWIQPPLVMEITEDFVMIHGPNYRANREDLQHNEKDGIDYFTSIENGFRFYYSSSESLLVLELKTDSGDWMRWADFK